MKHREYAPFTEPIHYHPETDHLCADNLAASASITESQTPYPELSRTNAVLHAQGNIHGGNGYCWELLADFDDRQEEETRLTVETYEELHALSWEAMRDPPVYQAIEGVNAIHDILKDTDLLPVLGLERTANHDDALERLFMPEYRHTWPGHFPSLESYTDDQLELMEGILKVNFIRFVQSQAGEAEVQALAELPRNQLLGAIMHGIHDLAGAMGDKNDRTSLTLDEPAATRLLDAAHALLIPPEELGWTSASPRVRRMMYMGLRAARLGILPEYPEADDEAAISRIPALLTIADLLRCYSTEDFAAPLAAFRRLPDELRNVWADIHALPLQHPGHLEGVGTEYATAFLRTFGKSEDAMYLALGCFAQIHLQAHRITYDIPIALGSKTRADPEIPYQKINFYNLVNTFKNTPPDLSKPIPLVYTINDGLLTPEVTERSNLRQGIGANLVHPNTYEAVF